MYEFSNPNPSLSKIHWNICSSEERPSTTPVRSTETTQSSSQGNHGVLVPEQLQRYQDQTRFEDSVVVFGHSSSAENPSLSHQQQALKAIRDFETKVKGASRGSAIGKGE